MVSKGWKLAILLVTLFANMFDVISDWLFYGGHLLMFKDGLVFGPYNQTIVTASLVICIIASITFLIEMVFDAVKFHMDNDILELAAEIITFVTLLIEDLPQASINLQIAMCKRDDTNVFQIIKASTTIFEVLLKSAFICIPFCRNRCKIPKGENKHRLRIVLKILTIILITIICILSIVVLRIVTAYPIKIYSDSLNRQDMEPYLRDVGVFMRLENTHPTLPKMKENQWMLLTYLTRITELSVPADGLFLSIIFTTVPLPYIWVRKHFPGSPESLSCYEWNSTSSILLPRQECSNIITSTTNSTTVSMRFTYVSPNSYQPAGDIHYHSEIRQKFDHILINETVTLKYFQVRSKVKGDLALTSVDGSQYWFYNDPTDLRSVREVWKNNCESTGRESPKLDPNMFVRCVF